LFFYRKDLAGFKTCQVLELPAKIAVAKNFILS
jgi:hypothetical protein